MSVAFSQEVCQGVEFDFTPSFPEGATDFVLLNNPEGVTIESGRIALSDTVVLGDYYLIINYTVGEGGPAGQMIVYLSVKECEEKLFKTNYVVCRAGNQTIKLAGSGTLGTPDFASHSISFTSPGENTYVINTSTMTLNQVYEVEVTVEGEPKTFTIKAINCAASSVQNVTDCEKEPIQVIWKNRAGGWNNYWFIQEKEYLVDQSEGKTYINKNDEKKWTTKGNIYDEVAIQQNQIPKSHVNLIRSLRDSIQAYIALDISDPLTFLPIILEEDSFRLYSTGEEYFGVAFKFSYAKKRKVQMQ